MRILHVSGKFLPVKGGGPYYVHHLSRQLERAGHDCRVITTDTGGDPSVETVATTRSPAMTVTGAPIAPTFPLTLDRAIRSFDPDVIHANYPLPFYPDVAAALAALRSRPLVLTAHGAFEMSFKSLVGVVGHIYNRSFLRATLRASDCLHVSNRAILDAFDVYGRHENKASVVPIGVDTEWFDPATVSGPAPYPDDRPTVLYVGALRRYKGLDDLLAAFTRLRDHVDARLLIVGEGPERPSLRRQTRERGLTGTVQFVDHVDDETLRRVYAHADAFVLPSPTIRESLGLVALEALAMGVPTVVTAGSGVGRLLADEPAGVVVDPHAPAAIADALASLLDDGADRTEQGRAGRALVTDRFAWPSLVDEYVSVYERARSTKRDL